MPGLELVRSPGRVVFRVTRPRISGVLRPRLLLTWLVLAVAAAGVFGLTVGAGSGDYTVPPGGIVPALRGTGAPADVFVVRELRLPRAAVALLGGAALGMSGAIFQAVTRNPLASPDMLGITQGAGAAVAAGVVLGAGTGLGTQTLGLAGAVGAGLLIYLLAWNRGTTGYRIVLVGIGISWMCVSVTTYLLSRAEPYQAQKMLGWLVGNLNDRGWAHAQPLALALVVLVPPVLLLGRLQRALHLGDEVATGLGTPVQRVRMALLLCGAALAAFATAAAGPVLFVALAAPQIARRLARSPAPPVVSAALTGSVIVLVSDLIGQRLLADMVLPVGVVTGVLGAPFLLWQLARTGRPGA
ncbi:iron complex transport system permease protein [Streptosporangium becharense]|uniref:Iron complex transport system permease protein n=1 Tax=Streptosporangium becharense TaxID=1816182 RepID=A0A7W9IGS4_9ACTN|nr:iron chelate uptake ABC transporter family permease subunit [Streptosporangium becharense]MBB2912754.1 iron complex transport system permease protein [Streptosporangium becharense]MBB5820417.1 iron complex transport system permease protein [Streptosporangium becharense]